MHILRYVSFSALLLLLTACSTLLSPPPTTQVTSTLHHLSWQQRQKQLRTIKSWYIQGAIGITHNNKTDIASFSWQNKLRSYLINIYGPMHLSNVQISGDDTHATLLQSSGGKMQADSPEELLQRRLGWNLPIANLNYWIRSLPAPTSSTNPKVKASELQFDQDNHLIKLTQQDWQIIYSDYKSVNNVDLPSKIYLFTPQLRIKIVIKTWLEIGA